METNEGLTVKELFQRRSMFKEMLEVCKDEGSKYELVKELKQVEDELREIGELIKVKE